MKPHPTFRQYFITQGDKATSQKAFYFPAPFEPVKMNNLGFNLYQFQFSFKNLCIKKIKFFDNYKI